MKIKINIDNTVFGNQYKKFKHGWSETVFKIQIWEL